MTTLTSTPSHVLQSAVSDRVRLWLLPLMLALLLAGGLSALLTPFPAAAAGPLCYVDADASGAATGDSWTDAYTTVQDALADPGCTEIWVAEGAYYPDEGAGQTEDVVTSTFALTNGVALYGGFDGTETARDQRDPAANITVLSGDIDQNDITDPNGVVTDTANINGANAYHVLIGSGTDSSAVLDGFTITAGQANGPSWPDYAGGGMYNDAGSPTLTNVTFSANLASDYGGGMYNRNSSPALTDVTFSGNSSGGNIYHGGGGGMYNYNSSPALTDVTFSTNSATSGNGGGMHNDNSSPALTNVAFSGNSASRGGGMYNGYHSSPALTNVTFSGNSASNRGGGMYNGGSNPALTNVTFSGNSAYSGGGIYNYDSSSPALTNVIIANSASGGDCINGVAGSVDAGSANNLIEDSAHACGLINGTDGNIIGSDPNLGPLTDYGGPGKQVFSLLAGSPAVDAGTNTGCPTTDQRGASRPVGTACDIGAYELDFSLAKYASNAAPQPGQTITFTIVAASTGVTLTNASISDPLPSGLNFIGPITLDDPTGTGTAGSVPPTLVSGLNLHPGDAVTVTFPVTISTWADLFNTAAISATQLVTPVTAAVLISPPKGPLCYVDADASGEAIGATWADAYTTVQDALADPNCTEIWVAKGVYYPDEGTGQTEDVVTSTFVLTNGVALYGGFDGTETARDQRDPAVNITVLSGDIDQNDITAPSGVVTTTDNITGTNAYHVVTGSHTDATAVLDGFTVTAGDGDSVNGSDGGWGGGMYISSGNPSVSNVVFFGNCASLYGGGMAVSGGQPRLTHVVFQNNRAHIHGGGLYNDTTMFGNNRAPILTEVTFYGNHADNTGGALYNRMGEVSLTDVTFSANSAGNDGGGMYNGTGGPLLTNVTFSGNYAGHNGGGLYNYYHNIASGIVLTNVTFSDNTATESGGGMFNSDGSPVLTNVTFSGNGAGNSGGGLLTYSGRLMLTNVIIANSIAGGDCVGTGLDRASHNNLIEDSTHTCGLTNGSNGNIIGQAPKLGPLTDYGGPGKQVFPLLLGSPAIDAGTNTTCPATDQRGTARPIGATCDIGAYELDTFSLVIAKSADNPTPLPGQTITFTVVVTNTGPLVTNGLLSDTLPAGLNFLGPVTLEPHGAGTIGAAPPTLASSLTISANQRITVTFPVTVSRGLAAETALTNTAAISATEIPTPTRASAMVTVGNAPPVADAGAPQTVNPGASVTLDGSGSYDPNGDPLTYQWIQTGGITVTLFGAATVSPAFTAPNAPGILTFTLSVTDTSGLTDTATTTVTVNAAPVADAGAPQTVNPGASVTLDGSASSDPNGDALTYQWTQTGGVTVTLSGATTVSPTFTAPAASGMLTFTLTVTDTGGLTDTATTTVTVPNIAPTADAGAPQTVNPGDSVTLDGSASSDPNGDPLTYHWTQTGGVTVMLSDATSISPTFTAPAASGMLTFTLTVTDTGGLTDTTTTTVTVKKYCIYLPLVLKP